MLQRTLYRGRWEGGGVAVRGKGRQEAGSCCRTRRLLPPRSPRASHHLLSRLLLNRYRSESCQAQGRPLLSRVIPLYSLLPAFPPSSCVLRTSGGNARISGWSLPSQPSKKGCLLDAEGGGEKGESSVPASDRVRWLIIDNWIGIPLCCRDGG